MRTLQCKLNNSQQCCIFRNEESKAHCVIACTLRPKNTAFRSHVFSFVMTESLCKKKKKKAFLYDASTVRKLIKLFLDDYSNVVHSAVCVLL